MITSASDLETGSLYYIHMNTREYLGVYEGIHEATPLYMSFELLASYCSDLNWKVIHLEFLDMHTIKPVPLSDLPLYMYLPYRTPLFNKYMAGDL